MRAARAVHVSQPTLSRNIALLEQSLGVRLFDRSATSVEPTAFGRLVIERGRALLAREADLQREIALQAGLETGSLAVSAGPFPFETSVAVAVAGLIEAHPKLRVTATVAHTRDVVRDVLAGQVDVGIGDRLVAGKQKRLQVEPLPSHKIFLACRAGHPLLKKGRLVPADIVAYPFTSTHVLGHMARLFGPPVESAAARSGSFDPVSGDYNPAVLVNAQYLARKIACGSDALVSGTAAMLAPDLDAGRLVRLNLQIPEMHVAYAIVTLKGRTPSPSALKFMDLLREVEAEVVRTESPPQALADSRQRGTSTSRRSSRRARTASP
jgi:DNA-binding transcriptional LysR family regulator